MIVHHEMQNRWSLPRGRVLRRALRSDPTQEYLLYVPHSASPDARVLVSVHGISRNAHEQAAVFSPMCEARGVVMLVPIFDPTRTTSVWDGGDGDSGSTCCCTNSWSRWRA